MLVNIAHQRLMWIVRATVVLLLSMFGIHAWLSHHSSVGLPIKPASTTCSADLLVRPFIFRILPNGMVSLGEDVFLKPEAMQRLFYIGAANPKRTLLFDADDSAAFEDVVQTLSAVRAELPQWNILLVTPATRNACEQWIHVHSGPAA